MILLVVKFKGSTDDALTSARNANHAIRMYSAGFVTTGDGESMVQDKDGHFSVNVTQCSEGKRELVNRTLRGLNFEIKD